MKQNETLLQKKISFLEARMERYLALKDSDMDRKTLSKMRKQYNSDRCISQYAWALEKLVSENQMEYLAHDNDNFGSITEAVIKSYLKGKAVGMGAVGETDLVQGGKRFDIKMVLKGSTNGASGVNLETKDDLLLITNQGVKIIRNEDIKHLNKENAFKAGTTRLVFKAFNCEYAIETAFTKRLTKELGVNIW